MEWKMLGYILWPFGNFSGRLAYLMAIWYILVRCTYQEKVRQPLSPKQT
jgi:hypothetical protein